jgi:hypothetical protein
VRGGLGTTPRLLLLGLVDEGLVNMGDHTAASNGGLDKGVELLISTDGELKVTGSDALHLKILRRVTRELEHLSSEVLKDGGRVHGSGGSDTAVLVHALLEETVNTTDRELPGAPGSGRLAHGTRIRTPEI